MANTAPMTAGSDENLEQEESDEYSDFGEEEEESSQEDQGSSGEDEDEDQQGGLTALLLGRTEAEKEEEEEDSEAEGDNEYVVSDKPAVEPANPQVKKRRINDVNPTEGVHHNGAKDDDSASKRARV